MHFSKILIMNTVYFKSFVVKLYSTHNIQKYPLILVPHFYNNARANSRQFDNDSTYFVIYAIYVIYSGADLEIHL